MGTNGLTGRPTRLMCLSVVMLGLIACCPVMSFAQTAGSIVGTVTDTSGAVLPGVTVEASSPALIEKTRTVVTNEQGMYQIADLRPGAYTVTFTLVVMPFGNSRM